MIITSAASFSVFDLNHKYNINFIIYLTSEQRP